MSQSKTKNYRRIVRKATGKQKKALADNIIAVRSAFIREIKAYSFRIRLGIAWDILVKGK